MKKLIKYSVAIIGLHYLVSASLLGQITVHSNHIVRYQQSYDHSGPANFGGNQAFCWGNDILVNYYRWGHTYTTNACLFDKSRRSFVGIIQGKSTNGGQGWTSTKPSNHLADGATPSNQPSAINFTAPGFCMVVDFFVGGGGATFPDNYDARYFVSMDKGNTWEGPYWFQGLRQTVPISKWSNNGFSFSSRTDYIVNSSNEIFFFHSVKPNNNRYWNNSFENGQDRWDRTLMSKSTDGGRNWEFVSWIKSPDVEGRGVMPATVRLSSNKLVTALRCRRKNDSQYGNTWIDTYVSTNNGSSWSFQKKVAPYTGEPNGNPPAMTKTNDGKLVMAWGYRKPEYKMKVSVSSDQGNSWSTHNLRTDYITSCNRDTFGDLLGYPRIFRRADGKLVCVYWWHTNSNPWNHVASTVFSVGSPSDNGDY